MALNDPKLNLGCGTWSFPGFVNLDRADLPGVDVVHDLDHHPWPFASGRFEHIYACQVFEHVADPIGFMREAWRVLQPGGDLFLMVPHWQSENSHTDPTHVRHCTERTFDYWCAGTELHNQFGAAYAGTCVFDRESVERVNDDIHAHLRKR